MTIQQIRRAPFDLATPVPRLFGLLQVATIRDSGPWMTGGANIAISWNCVDGSHIDYDCAPATATKSFNSPESIDGHMFYVYLGGECKGPGTDVEADIRRVFTLRESALVERGFSQWVLGGPAGTTGADVATLAQLEADLLPYAGAPTIHLGVSAATVLAAADAIRLGADGWTTVTGSKVVIGTGYDPWLVAGTGEVTIARSDRIDTTSFATDDNTIVTLAERLYLVAADCIVVTGVTTP